MNIHELEDMVEALIHLRCLSRPRSGKRLHTETATMLLSQLVQDNGYDPGSSERDAEKLKLSLVEAHPSQSGFHILYRQLDVVLEQTAKITGTFDLFRELQRFCNFCSKMRGYGVTQDPVGMSIYTWCREDQRYPATTLDGASKLYLQWVIDSYTKDDDSLWVSFKMA